MDIMDSGHVNAFCGFFDVSFKGSPENPADFEVQLSTAPDPRGSTHWGQQLFALQPAIQCQRGELAFELWSAHTDQSPGSCYMMIAGGRPETVYMPHWGQQLFALQPAIQCQRGELVWSARH